MQSETIGKLADALSKAQAEMKAPTKGRTASIKSDKGSYSYKYADLADVIECFRGPLSKNGLAVAQTMTPVDGHLVMTTKLLHSSGEWLASDYPIAAYNRPQEQGSAITYARRYAVTALLGIAAEDDDDGQAAQHGKPKHEEEEQPRALPPDAQAINELAADIQQITGKGIPDIIAAASGFDKDGKHQAFDDPAKAASRPKWLASTKGRLEKELHQLRAKSEPGAAEAAQAFADGLETAPCGRKHAPSEKCLQCAVELRP